MKDSKLYFIHCISPVHVGTGQGVGTVDMPIMRERVTEWPLIPGSSMKGAYRELFRKVGQAEEWLNTAFGKSGDDNGNAGSLVMSDSRLLVFPVASRHGTFAYVTCPLAIKRLFRDTTAAGLEIPSLDWNALEGKPDEEQVITGPNSKVVDDGNVYIDEFKCKAVENKPFGVWIDWLAEALFDDHLSMGIFSERLVLVSDDAFQYFVTMCCEVVPRIRIDSEKKTTKSGALWYEEYLPVESVMYGVLWCDKIHSPSRQITVQDLLDTLTGEMVMQIGGNVTVGKGRVRCRFLEEGVV